MKNPGRNDDRQTVVYGTLTVCCVAYETSCSILAIVGGKPRVREPHYRPPVFASRAAAAPALLFA
jgi:hypothetical protein